MRIAIFYSDDVFSNAIFCRLLAEEDVLDEVVAIFKDTHFNKMMLHKLFSRDSDYSSRFVLSNLFINWVSALHKRILGRTSFLSLARRRNIPVIASGDFNSPDILLYLQEKKPDIVINKASQILRRQVLAIPKQGCVNIHCSLLPKYKGWVSSFWVLQKKESQTGVTIHRMSERLDAGEVLKQAVVPIEDGDTYYGLQKKCVQAAAGLLREFLRGVDRSASAQASAQAEGYFGFPSGNDMRLFVRNGKRLINLREMLSLIMRGF